jgi:catechol 2,3-dioxygenase-like lactoylglutathione lyase family enzyme
VYHPGVPPGPVIPVLRIFDVPKALEFYLGFLGFQEDWRHQFGPDFPLYLQVSKESVALHLSEHHGDASPGAKVRIEIADVAGTCAELQANPYRYSKPAVETTEWKTREFTVKDPFGNTLVFWQRG